MLPPVPMATEAWFLMVCFSLAAHRFREAAYMHHRVFTFYDRVSDDLCTHCPIVFKYLAVSVTVNCYGYIVPGQSSNKGDVFSLKRYLREGETALRAASQMFLYIRPLGRSLIYYARGATVTISILLLIHPGSTPGHKY